jgi:TonB family protein
VMFMHTDTNTPVTATAPDAVSTPTPQAAAPAPEVRQEPKQVAKAAKPTPAPKQPETKQLETKQPENKQPAAAPETAAPAVPVSGIIEQPLPEIMDRARNSIHGRVRFTVRVDVSPAGTVTDAKVESGGASKYFGDRAVAAVRQWKFEPVSVNGSQVGQRWRVRFEFVKSGTKVQPQRVSP